MHEGVQLCQGPQTEFAVFVKVQQGAESITCSWFWATRDSGKNLFDEVGQGSPERRFPGFTEQSVQQATLSAGQSGIGCKRSADAALPAHMGAVIAARPRIQEAPPLRDW